MSYVRLIAALVVVPLFGLMLFIIALDLFFYMRAMVDRVTSRLQARRIGYLRLQQ